MRSAVRVPASSAAPRPRACEGCLDGVLLLHHHPIRAQAPDVIASVRAFAMYSRFPVWSVNTRLGFPRGLRQLRFRAVVLHYTLFYAAFEPLTPPFRAYLDACAGAHKIALFQDEQAYTRDRFEFCDRYAISSVYTLLAPEQFDAVYGRHTRVPRLVSYHPGYVSDHLLDAARELAKPDADRRIDIGYRGRRLADHWGAAAREKYEIAVEFRRHAAGRRLMLDIETAEDKRIYGRRWYEFIADCRAMLGTESGASTFDMGDGSSAGIEIPYRTISPRHLEAAAFRVCQILYEGHYSGVLEPGVHYIPLRKDFANFDSVIEQFRDRDRRAEIAENAHRDLIASGDLSHQRFVAEVDRELEAAGLRPSAPSVAAGVSAALYPSLPERRLRTAWMALRDSSLPRPPVRAWWRGLRKIPQRAALPHRPRRSSNG
jgi:hypothetical protein